LGNLVDEGSSELLFRILESGMLGSSYEDLPNCVAERSAVGYGRRSSDENGISKAMVWGQSEYTSVLRLAT
jgi:hypothetical protein